MLPESLSIRSLLCAFVLTAQVSQAAMVMPGHQGGRFGNVRALHLALDQWMTHGGWGSNNGSGSLGGSLSLVGSSSLGGSGLIHAGADTLTQGGTIGPGNSPGIMTLSGLYTLGSSFSYELGGLGGGSDTGSGAFAWITVLQAGDPPAWGDSGSFSVSSGNITGAVTGSSWMTDTSGLWYGQTWTVVPEPSVALLGGLGLLGLLRRRR